MSDTAPDTGTDPAPDTQDAPPTDTVDDTDWKAEAEKWQAMARKHEERSKTNAGAAKELEAAKLAALSDQEKAVAIARQEGAAEAFQRLGGQLVDMAVKAAVAGRNIDADALLDGLDRTRFLTDDGLVDEASLGAWVDRIAPKPDPSVFPDLGQGARQNGGAMALNGDPLLRSVIDKLKS